MNFKKKSELTMSNEIIKYIDKKTEILFWSYFSNSYFIEFAINRKR